WRERGEGGLNRVGRSGCKSVWSLANHKHGRHSAEGGPTAVRHHRLILTRRVAAAKFQRVVVEPGRRIFRRCQAREGFEFHQLGGFDVQVAPPEGLGLSLPGTYAAWMLRHGRDQRGFGCLRRSEPGW